jgi:hypothetical protein
MQVINEKELMDKIQQQQSDFSKVAGQLSAINKYLDDSGFPKMKPTQMRVKAFSLQYQIEKLIHKRIMTMNSSPMENENYIGDCDE